MADPVAQRGVRYGVFGVLVMWLAATGLVNHPRTKNFAKRHFDPLGVHLPVSGYFAPRPGAHDLHLLVRHELADGTMTPWQERALGSRRDTFLSMWWNAGRREQKAIFDLGTVLTTYADDPRLEERPEYLQYGTSYLSVLNFVTHRCERPPDARRVQFMIAASPGFDDRRPPHARIVSDFHDVA
ncbi:hypothetical protein [Streptomyces sp. NPDC058155]|uniref:hypothetical protein n=1 Tax=Streptomyces sp. NPDC058155 TaxID=3346359 RepID=UPI0036E66068